MRKKILHVLKMNQYSGAENVAISICRKLKDQYEFVYTCPDGPIRQWLEKESINFFPMNRFSAIELKRVLEACRPDIVHAHDFSSSVLCGSMKKDFFLISHLHNNPPWMRRWNIKSTLYRLALKNIDKVLLVSDSIKNEAVFLRDIESGIEVIGNPVDEERVRYMADRFQAEASDLLYVGRMTEQKDPQCFIRIIKELCSKRLKVSALMLGDGELFLDCERQIAQCGMQHAIRMIGFCENPYPYMKSTKLLLAPSKWEGYGLVAAEALALGVPVLANAAGGLNSIFQNCLEALCHSELEMSKKAAMLLTDAEYYAEYRDRMAEKVHLMSIKKYMEILEQFYG